MSAKLFVFFFYKFNGYRFDYLMNFFQSHVIENCIKSPNYFLESLFKIHPDSLKIYNLVFIIIP